jgi:hypothetical protein
MSRDAGVTYPRPEDVICEFALRRMMVRHGLSWNQLAKRVGLSAAGLDGAVGAASPGVRERIEAALVLEAGALKINWRES